MIAQLRRLAGVASDMRYDQASDTPVVRPRMAGGGTDGNIYTNAGIPCVVLSTGMAQVHTPDEHIAIQDMVDAARVLMALLTDPGA